MKLNPHSTCTTPTSGPIPVRPSLVETIVSVHDLVAPIVERAQECGPLPAIDTQEFLDAPRHVKVAVLLVAGVAWVVENPRAQHRRDMAEAGAAISAALPDGWADNHVPFEQLLRERGLEVGPDGRPTARRVRDTRADYPGRGAA